MDCGSLNLIVSKNFFDSSLPVLYEYHEKNNNNVACVQQKCRFFTKKS